MNRKNITLIGIIVAAILACIAIWAFVGSVVPYTHDFIEAKSGKFIQVYGQLDKSSIKEDGFVILDEQGNFLKIHSKKALPQNLVHADYTVVSGKFDKLSQTFEADSVLVKCPSKYEEKQTP